MESEKLKDDLELAIQTIKTKTASDREEVFYLFKSLVTRYYSLTDKDFLDSTSYQRYNKSRQMFFETNNLNKELTWLANPSEEWFVTDNYFQTKATILMMLVPFR